MVNKYVKKPVVIEACLYDGTNKSLTDMLLTWGDSFVKASWIVASGHPNNTVRLDKLVIRTLEGDHTVSVGDMVIKGISGEFYPCKPDIFEKTYDAVP